jgi:hypothetical protein
MTPRDAHLDSEEDGSSDDGGFALVEASQPQEGAAETDDVTFVAGVFNAPRLKAAPVARRPLGLVFDLDGTLVAEALDDSDACFPDSVFLRPGVQHFLEWCCNRGHRLAIWTAGHSSWAHYVSWKLLGGSGAGSIRFEFVWDGTMLRKRRRIPRDAHGLQTQSGPTVPTNAGTNRGCCWCGPYRDECDRCECRLNRVFQCPCRFTKDLNKVWSKKYAQYCRDRTLLIENTPQQCLRNYGNAVYVPTYTGDPKDRILFHLQRLIEQLERTDNVRTVSKCDCCYKAHHRGRLHACREQNWWSHAGRSNATNKEDDLRSLPTLSCQPVARKSAQNGTIAVMTTQSDSFSPDNASSLVVEPTASF